MKRRFSMSARARQDLIEIGDFIARDDRAAARRWVARLRQRARAIVANPFAGRRVPELERDDLREVLLGNYRIVYQVTDAHVSILMVIEGHRALPAIED